MTDFFDRLGLPRRFALDGAALERAYLARSRAVHPDFHAGGGSADLSASLELSAALNEAYNTLRDPFRRADYLVGLYGGPSAQDEKGADPAFLAEMMDVRERVEELRGGTPCGLAAAELRAELVARSDALEGDVAAAFARYEALPDAHPDRPRHLRDARRSLNALRTLRSLLRTLPDD